MIGLQIIIIQYASQRFHCNFIFYELSNKFFLNSESSEWLLYVRLLHLYTSFYITSFYIMIYIIIQLAFMFSCKCIDEKFPLHW